MGREPGGITAYKMPDTILIVDDDELNRAILDNIFSSEYSIEEAENGRQGLAKLMDHPERICAVLLDVVMPVMDGIETLRTMNALGMTEQIPVFLITAESGDGTLKEAYSLGVMDVILKPVVPYVVQRRIDSVIELFRARKRLRNKVVEQQTEIFQQAQQIIELNMGMIEALSTAIEFRSGESGSHVRRIHDITEYMLRHTELGAGLSGEEIQHIAMASIMHDVGKIAIPDAILNKPGRLTPEEFEVMKTHTLQGAELLEACVFCPADQPLLRKETLASLALCASGTKKGQEKALIWRPAFGEKAGSPVLFPRRFFAELRALPKGQGGSCVIRSHTEAVRLLQVRDPMELADVDTPEDLGSMKSWKSSVRQR